MQITDQMYDCSPRLRAAFAASGLSQVELARRVGTSPPQIQKILKGQRPGVSAATVRRLALALDVSADYLLGLRDTP